MWGTATIQSVPSGEDKVMTINFPESFESAPKVVATCAGWLAVRALFTNQTTTTKTEIGVQHIQGVTLNVPVDWVAIG